MAKCLVLGANGFLGSHLVDSLVANGHQVRAFSKFSSDTYNFQNDSKIEVKSGDFLNRNDVAEALKDVEYVFHFISTTTPATAENDPLIDIETNVHATVEMLQEIVGKNVKKVIFASTGGAIYGTEASHPLKETDLPLPISPYAIGKLTIEQYLRYFKIKHGIQSVSFRISNPYGERQPLNRKQGVIPIFMEKLYRGEPITVLGDGSMERDYIYVKDVADLITEVFEREMKEEVYNLGSGESITVDELIKRVESTTNKTAQKEHKPAPPTFIHKVLLDTSRFVDEFNLKPKTSMLDGMKATWSYIVAENGKEETTHE